MAISQRGVRRGASHPQAAQLVTEGSYTAPTYILPVELHLRHLSAQYVGIPKLASAPSKKTQPQAIDMYDFKLL